KRGLRAEGIVRDLLSQFLSLSPGEIDIERQFSDLGFDSMLVVRISAGLKQKYGVEIAPAAFFELTTPQQLIALIDHSYGDILQGSAAPDDHQQPPIAIIGVSGVFPRSPSIDVLWRNLVDGKNCIEEVPADRWSLDGRKDGKWGGFIEDFYHFDPLFFNISPQETEMISPKERLFLQGAWHALEDAGYTPMDLARERVGVFAGVTRSGIDPYRTSPFTISNRVSYVMNFQGPSMTIDTACSSSLVAIHEACRHMISGE